MKQIHFTIEIDAAREKVWEILWSTQSYPQWTRVFNEGSNAESTWKEGAEIRFITAEGSGMHSVIEVMQLHEQMTFRHKGEVHNFENHPFSEAMGDWTNAIESYTLSETPRGSILRVELSTLEEYLPFFNTVFPQALGIIKMLSEQKEHRITVQATIQKPIDDVWNKWITPNDICQWNAASEDWHTPRAENDVQENGHFNIRMEAKDGSFGFDLKGTYTCVLPSKRLDYFLEDHRKVSVLFSDLGESVVITQTFEPEKENAEELQQFGWQAILNNFKKYCEKT